MVFELDYGGNYPGYTKKEEKITVEEYTIYIEDIINLQLLEGYQLRYGVIDEIVRGPVEETKRVEEDFSRGRAYREFKDLYRNCVSLGNRLLVIAKAVVERYRKKGMFGGRTFRGHGYYGSIPRKTASQLGNFSGMTRYREKKGLIQVYYYYTLKDLDNEYKQKYTYPSSEARDRQSKIREALKQAGYLGEKRPELEEELELLRVGVQRAKAHNRGIDNDKKVAIDKLLSEEKEQIAEILGIIQPYQSIRDYYHFGFLRSRGANFQSEYTKKYQIILIDLQKRYVAALEPFLKTITNWEEIDDTPALKAKVQKQVDAIKIPCREEHAKLLLQFKQEISELLRTKFYDPFNKDKQQIPDDFELLQDLQTTLTQKHSHYSLKVDLLISQHEKR